MPTYSRKAQVLFTEEQFNELQAIANKEHKKISALIREAVEETYLKKERSRQVRNAADKLLCLAEKNPVDIPFNHEEWEEEYSKIKGAISDD